MTLVGVLAVIVAVAILPVGLLDPAVSGMAAWLAIVLGGLSSVAISSKLRYCVASITISLLSVLALRLYSPSGSVDFDASVLTDVLLVMAIPLALSSVLISIGAFRRRQA